MSIDIIFRNEVITVDDTFSIDFSGGIYPQGLQGERGPQGDRGPAGPAGLEGPRGPKGDPGHTPVKGVDYWTSSDIESMESDILQSQTITGIQSDITQLNGDLTELSGALSEIDDYVYDLMSDITERSTSKNLYNKDACNPQNGKYYATATGVITDSGAYAITGKIPVSENTTYTFSSTTKATEYCRPVYFSGSEGQTFISAEANSGTKTFTTPSGCTFVGINMFARTIAEGDYEAAIAVAMLELGSTASPYEPYGGALYVPLDVIEEGDVFEDMITATNNDVGKALIVKSVDNNKVSEWKFETPSEKVRTRNLYDKDTANAQDGKCCDNYGAIVASSYYAFTGFANCEANKTYIFNVGGALVQYAIYFNGNTYISREKIDGASFTTPANCTKVAFNIFASQHNTENFEYAINHAQLEEGSVATEYVPYYVGISDKINSLYTTITIGKNLYDKNTANPQNEKACDNYGNINESTYYAFTGIAPCSGGTTYTFSAGDALVQYAVYFNGDTFLSREIINGASFTTPANCNGVGFNLFAAQHTAEEYVAAINAAQLENGVRATLYEAYNSTTEQGYSFIEQGIGVNRSKAISQKAVTDMFAYPKHSSWWNGKKGDSLGDSITYKFNRFQKFVKSYLNLAEFYNNGMTGTKMAGPTDPTWGDSMWMDSRINALHADADFITILGGANDSALEEIGTVSIENYDTDTYCGAFNVVISKIYYRFLALSAGHYQNVDYSGVTKLSSPHNVILIPCTMFYVPGGIANLKAKADAIKTLSEAWSLRVCDFYGTVQANPFVANYYWGQSDNVHPTELFYKERLAPILISNLEYLKQIDFGNVE